MRMIWLATALVFSASISLAQEPRLSDRLCDAAKIGGRDLADCLRMAADKSDRELTTTFEAAVKSIDSKPRLLSSQRTRWKRSLTDAETQWIGWRDSECQDVAPFEAGMNAKGGDPRLACIIDQDARRIADLKERYP
jgi:uncharacterized protein YecT (DUF1311 family)